MNSQRMTRIAVTTAAAAVATMPFAVPAIAATPGHGKHRPFTARDTDRDGTPDGWEVANGLNRAATTRTTTSTVTG